MLNPIRIRDVGRRPIVGLCRLVADRPGASQLKLDEGYILLGIAEPARSAL